MEQNTARNFALQLGSLASLYISISAFIAVTFGIINIFYPDAATYSWEYTSAQSSIRFGIAMLLVFFPTYLFLTRAVQKIRRTEQGMYLSLTKWVVYLSLLVCAGVLLGDIVMVIYNFLNGELTTRFLLKAVVLAVVLSCALYYYIKDAQGYWITHESYSKLYGLFASLIALGALVLGIVYADSPSKVREMRIDEGQVSNLTDMQWRVEDHYNVKKVLPKTIEEVYTSSGIETPKAPEGRDVYEYSVIDEDSYKLCATFVYPSVPNELGRPAVSPLTNPYNNWDHGAGKTCFERNVAKPEVAKSL